MLTTIIIFKFDLLSNAFTVIALHEFYCCQNPAPLADVLAALIIRHKDGEKTESSRKFPTGHSLLTVKESDPCNSIPQLGLVQVPPRDSFPFPLIRISNKLELNLL